MGSLNTIPRSAQKEQSGAFLDTFATLISAFTQPHFSVFLIYPVEWHRHWDPVAPPRATKMVSHQPPCCRCMLPAVVSCGVATRLRIIGQRSYQVAGKLRPPTPVAQKPGYGARRKFTMVRPPSIFGALVALLLAGFPAVQVAAKSGARATTFHDCVGGTSCYVRNLCRDADGDFLYMKTHLGIDGANYDADGFLIGQPKKEQRYWASKSHLLELQEMPLSVSHLALPNFRKEEDKRKETAVPMGSVPGVDGAPLEQAAVEPKDRTPNAAGMVPPSNGPTPGSQVSTEDCIKLVADNSGDPQQIANCKLDTRFLGRMRYVTQPPGVDELPYPYDDDQADPDTVRVVYSPFWNSPGHNLFDEMMPLVIALGMHGLLETGRDTDDEFSMDDDGADRDLASPPPPRRPRPVRVAMTNVPIHVELHRPAKFIKWMVELLHSETRTDAPAGDAATPRKRTIWINPKLDGVSLSDVTNTTKYDFRPLHRLPIVDSEFPRERCFRRTVVGMSGLGAFQIHHFGEYLKRGNLICKNG